MSELMRVQRYVQQVAEAIAAVVRLDIAVYDDASHLVAATGHGVHRDIWQNLKDFVCREAMRTRQAILNREPGHSKVCAPCSLAPHCPEKADITCPILLKGEPIGVITINAFDEEQKEQLLGNADHFMEFSQKMADMISVKVAEQHLFDRIYYLAQQLKIFIGSVREAIVAIDARGNVVEFNPAAEALFRLPAGKVVGKPLDAFLSDSVLIEALRTGRGCVEQEVFHRIGPHQVHAVCTAQPIVQDGQVTGVVATFRDMTQARRLAYELVSADKTGDCTFDDIKGISPGLENVKRQAQSVANSDSTVLIAGESGTGKELFARAIHAASHRRVGPFRAFNCAAIPETLAESELFGYEEGAFTGARRRGKPGRIELASGGTLFLDEVGDMPFYLQAKLLRVLEEHRVERVGGTTPVEVDLRLVAATHRSLEDMVKRGEFRHDLYYRLNVIPLFIPPLRERREDIEVLMGHFLDRYRHILGKEVDGFSADVYRLFLSYPWPGNVRELQNAIQYAVHMETTRTIRPQSIPARIREAAPPLASPLGPPLASPVAPPFLPGSVAAGMTGQTPGQQPFDQQPLPSLREAEKALLAAALSRYGHTLEGKRTVARILGVDLATVYRKMKRYHLS